jgi:hypothetical protein
VVVGNKKINPGKVFDLTLPLDQVAEGYRAMDERRAIKTLLRPLVKEAHMASSFAMRFLDHKRTRFLTQSHEGTGKGFTKRQSSFNSLCVLCVFV